MASGHRGAVLHQLRRLFERGSHAGLSEWQLLRRYLAARDEAAFEAIVARHGPMVLGVCRRALDDPQEVEDAFQATFLVLVRRASSLGEHDAIGPWLYGVASRVALRARSEAARRRSLGRHNLEQHTEAPEETVLRREIGTILDCELNRLPAKYRAPVVLCYLEGETQEAAARQLGLPLGTVKGRLVRARELLKSRLTRRGLALSAGSLIASLSQDAAAAVPDALRAMTVKHVIDSTARRAAAGAASAPVARLAESVLSALFVTKLKTSALVLSLLAGIALAAGALARPSAADRPTVIRTAFKPVEQPGTNEVGTPRNASESMKRKAQMPAEAASEDQSAPAPRATQNPRLDAKLLQRGYENALAAYREGKVDLAKVYLWSKRILEAEDDPSAPEEHRAALQAHANRMADLNRHVQSRASKGTELALSAAESDYYRQEAAELLRIALSPKPETNGDRPEGKPTGRIAQGTAPASTQTDGDRRAGRGPTAAPGRDARSLAIVAALDEPVPMNFPNETPLEDVLKYVKTATEGPKFPKGIPIYVDPVGLMEAQKTMTSPIQIDLEGVPLARTLQLSLHQIGLGYLIEDGLLYITAEGGRDPHLPDVRFTSSPIVDLMEKAEHGELDAAGVKELIEKLKARIEIAKLKREEALIESGGRTTNAERPPAQKAP